jgi:hypothetical protein
MNCSSTMSFIFLCLGLINHVYGLIPGYIYPFLHRHSVISPHCYTPRRRTLPSCKHASRVAVFWVTSWHRFFVVRYAVNTNAWGTWGRGDNAL